MKKFLLFLLAFVCFGENCLAQNKIIYDFKPDEEQKSENPPSI